MPAPQSLLCDIETYTEREGSHNPLGQNRHWQRTTQSYCGKGHYKICCTSKDPHGQRSSIIFFWLQSLLKGLWLSRPGTAPQAAQWVTVQWQIWMNKRPSVKCLLGKCEVHFFDRHKHVAGLLRFIVSMQTESDSPGQRIIKHLARYERRQAENMKNRASLCLFLYEEREWGQNEGRTRPSRDKSTSKQSNIKIFSFLLWSL